MITKREKSKNSSKIDNIDLGKNRVNKQNNLTQF